ncbi:tyrosine-type recombinase/integrase [Campylobacter gastrosuis]|uniref:Tyrosine-type recombinase/integrase n=1 Tax=Campylobacter gastrosuis TaxID=2974576 RepID=A0ABT7HSP2_9BACT|nr:site-specific integrase [Campylobacter gastrosuis]MDL0089946.1 tyrosine-type recombinase/integrase [Campylobacter gastrosuis]
MPKISAQLTITQLKNLKPKDKVYFVGDSDNLLIKIMPNGTKTFIYEFKINNKKKRLTLGKFGEMSLLEARERRNELKKQIKGGEYLKISDAYSFKAVFEKWIKTKSKISPKQLFWINRRFEALLLPIFSDTPIKEISRKDIINALNPLLESEKQETAKKVLGALNSFYKFALLHEYVEHNIIADIDKSALIGKREIKHYAHFKDEAELKNLIMAIKGYFGDIRLKVCALFMLYTAVRGENARFATWDEIDFKNSLWQIPAKKMKNGKSHEVFLSDSVKNMLLDYRKILPVKSEFLFPSLKSNLRPISENSVRAMIRNLGFNNEMITPHGFRATFSTIAHEKIDLHKQSSDIIDLCLAHVEKNKVKDAYNHAKNLKQRAVLMQWWSDFLDALV